MVDTGAIADLMIGSLFPDLDPISIWDTRCLGPRVKPAAIHLTRRLGPSGHRE